VTYAIAGTSSREALTGTWTARTIAVSGDPVHVVDAEDVGPEQRVEFAALTELCQLDPVVVPVVAIDAITRMRPQAGRLVTDAIHIESIQASALASGPSCSDRRCNLHLCVIADATGSEHHGCELTARAAGAAEEAISGTARNRAHGGQG
jgi:hypothetical protein